MCPLAGVHPRICLDLSPANAQGIGYPPQFNARIGVVERLCQAADALPPSIRLLIKETHRPAQLQTAYFARRVRRTQAEQPSLDHLSAESIAARFVAPPLWLVILPAAQLTSR
jgi:hypothetical protein